MHDNGNNQAYIFTEHNSEKSCKHKSCHIATYLWKSTYKLSDHQTDSHITFHTSISQKITDYPIDHIAHIFCFENPCSVM